MSNPESLLLSPNSSSCITNSYTEQRHSKRHSSDSLEIGKTFAGHRRHASDGSEASAPSPNLIAEAKNIEAASPFLLPFESLVFDANFDDTFQTSLGLMQLDKHNGGSLGHQVQTGQDEAQVRHSNQSTSQQSLHPFPTDDLSKSTNFLETDERTGLHSYNEMLLQQQTHASQLQQLQQQQQQQHQHQHQQQQQQRQFQQQPFGQETTYTPTGQFDAATSFAQDAMNIKSNGLNPRAFGVPMRNQIFEPTFAKADQLDVQQASNRRSLTPNLQFSVNNEFMPSSSAYLLPEDALVNPNLDFSNNNYLSSPSSFSNTNSNPNLSPGPFGSSARGSFDATASSHDFDLQMGNFTSTFDASDTYIDPLDGPSLSHRNSFDQSIGTASYDSSPLYPTNLSQIPSSSDYPLQAYFTQEQLHARRQHHLQQQHILEQSHLEEYQAITQHNAGINIFQSMYADAPNIALNPPTPSQRPSPNSRAFLRPEYPFPSAQPQMIVPTITTTVPTVTVSHPASDHAMSHNGHIPSFNLSPESAMPQIDGLSPPRGNRGRSNSDSRLMVAGGRARARSGNAIAHRGRGTTHRSTSATSASGSQSRSSSGSGSGSTSGDYLSARESSSNSRVQKFSSDGHSRRKSFSSMRDRSLDPHSDGSGPSNKQKNPATFICPIEDCGKRFTRAYNLRSHQRTHTNERPFICEVCGKAFARQHDRKRHEALHSGVKNHECPACHKKFARMDALSRHFKSETGKDCLKGREAEFDFLSHMDDGDDIGDEDEEWN